MTVEAEFEDRPALRRRLMLEALNHVPFEGWSAASMKLAGEAIGIDQAELRRICPAGAVELAVEFCRWGDELMVEELNWTELETVGMTARVASAVETRIKVVSEHREAVRKAVAQFSLPVNAPLGTRALWRTADQIWSSLGDRSDDYNWYTKRGMLCGVIGSSVLYWLGDTGDGTLTRAFIDRRIGDVMRVETAKQRVRNLPCGPQFLQSVERFAGWIRRPQDHKARHPGWVASGGLQ